MYVLEKLKSFPGHQKAIESCFVHWVETGRRQTIPLVWVAEHYADNICSWTTSELSRKEIGSGIDANQYSWTTSELSKREIYKDPEKLSEPDRESPEQNAPEEEYAAEEESYSGDEQLYVVIHCHGNATDIGLMMGTYWELASRLGIVVVGIEYSGYGLASGEPSLANTEADVEAAYNLAIDRGVPPERIIVYGQSVGSGPAMWLASKANIAGVILHSPLLSGIKAIDPDPTTCCRPSCVFKCFDFYPNDERITGKAPRTL